MPVHYSSWSPLSIPGCFLWLRADLGTVIGTGVKVWLDSSGNLNHATQVTGSQQPTLTVRDSQYNNNATLTFVNANTQYMSIASPVNNAAVQPITSIIVGNSSNANTEGTFQNGTGSTMSAGFLDDATGNVYMSAGTQVDTLVSVLNPAIMCLVANGAACKGYVNSAKAPVVSGNYGTDSFNGQGMQIGTGGVAALDGKIAEIICYNGALTPQQVSQVFQYASARYAPGSWS